MNNMDRAGAECISIGELLEGIDQIISECTQEYIFNKCVKTITIKGEHK